MNPKVSVIMPSLNVAPYIRQCLDSVVDQSLRDIELICVDAGSTDGTLEILREYEASDPRIKVLVSDKKSYGHQMNLGLDAASGDYIGIVETDDWAEPDMFEGMYSAAKESGADVVKSNYYWYYTKPAVKDKPFENLSGCDYSAVFSPRDDLRLFSTAPSIWSGIYRRSMLERHGIRFNETPGASYQDTSFFFMVCTAADSFFLLDRYYLHYRKDRDDSSINSGGKVYCLRNEMHYYEKYLEKYPEYKKAMFRPYMALKYEKYRWNYSRLAPQYQWDFLRVIFDDFSEHRKGGCLEPSYFTEKDWEDLGSIIDDPVRYFHRTCKKICTRPTGEALPEAEAIRSNAVESPDVTIIIPAYNTGKYIKNSIESTINQTYANIEIICVDDGSSDDTLSIIKDYAAGDDRITVLRQVNMGQSTARNHALKLARGRYVIFLDSDDMLREDSVEILLRTAEEKQLDILYYDAESFYETPELLDKFPYYVSAYEYKTDMTDPVTGMEFFCTAIEKKKYRVSVCVGFYRRSFLIGNDIYFLDGIFHEDNIFSFSCNMAADRVFHTEEKLYRRFIRSDSTMTSAKTFEHVYGYLVSVFFFDEAASSLPCDDRLLSAIATERRGLIWQMRNAYSALPDKSVFRSKLNPVELSRFDEMIRQQVVSSSSEEIIYHRSYEIGKAITWLPRKIRDVLRGPKSGRSSKGAVTDNAAVISNISGGQNRPYVSVIMPSLNVKDYIRQCMDSVLGQTMQNIEIICVDAGSTDGTLEILREYAERDPRINLIVSDVRSYGYQMNLGLDAASGEYIGIVETDDYISAEMYDRLYSMAATRGFPDVVKSGYVSVYEDEDKPDEEKFIVWANTGDVFSVRKHYEILGAHPSIWSCIYKRSFIEKRGIRFMPVPGAGWVDNPFLFRTMCEAENICWVKEALYYYRETRPGSSTQLRDCSIPIARINDIKDYLENTGKNDPQLERVLYKRAIYYIGMICDNPSLTEEDSREAKKMLRRFDQSVVSDMTAEAGAEYPEYFSGLHNDRKWSPGWFRKKLRGGIRCLREHGFIYTVKHTFHKLSRAFGEKEQRIFSKRKKKLRVLFIASDNNHTSGAFISMTVLNSILRKKFGVETLVVLPCEGSGKKLLDENNIPSVLIPSEDWVLPLSAERNEAVLEKIARAKRINEEASQKIKALIEREKIDVVHINTTYSYVGAAAATLTGTPFVWHLREFLEEDQGNTLWDRAAGNELINKADRVVAISDSIYKKYCDVIDKGRLVRIFNGVDAEKFYMPEKEILKSDPVVFTMIGGFEYYKGQIEFAKACVLLSKSGFNNFTVHFIGTGNAEVRETVEEIVSDGGIADKVVFLGYRKDVQNYLKISDVSFSCARSEAFGRTTAEAMLTGNLVIGADTAGTRELLRDGKNGLLYRQGDPKDLCEKMIEALASREKARELAETGRLYAFENYTADKNAGNIYDLYRSILSSDK